VLKEKTGIGPGLFFMVLYVSIFGYGIIHAPRVAAEYIGPNGYWGFILAFILSIPVMAGIAWLGRRFPNHSVIEYLPRLFGVFIGKVLGLLLLLAILVLMLRTSRIFSGGVNIFFLRRTPAWASAAFFLLVSLYIARQGIEGITRLAAFVFPLTFVLSFLAILFSMKHVELDNIRPVFFFESGLAVAAGTANLFSPFMVLLTALMVNPYLTEKEKGFPTMTGAAALGSLLILLTSVSGIGNYGAEGILRYSFPVFELSRKAQLPFVQQSFALLFSATWLSQVLVATGFFYFLLAEGAAQWLQVLNFKWFTLLLLPPVFFLNLFPIGVVGERTISSYLRVGSSLFTVGLVLALVIVAIFRRAGVQKGVS
jgi:spore germination protein